MDPRLFRLFGAKPQAPHDDFGGGGEGGDEERDAARGDDDADGDEGVPGDGDGDGDEGEGGDDGDDADGADEADGGPKDGDDGAEDGEDADFERLGHRTQKRIKKLVAEAKDLRRQLDEARRLGGEDGQTILSAAAKAGLLPRLVTKELADGLNALESKRDALSYIEGLLDGDDDDFTIGEREYSRRQLERKERALATEVDRLESRFGKDRDRAAEETKALIELGLSARKAGWRPGKGGEGKETTARKPREWPDESSARGTKKPGEARQRLDYGDVDDDETLEAMIAAERSRKKGNR